jgi:hypothetical protein
MTTPTDAARKLLRGSMFVGFTFHTGFSLRFEKAGGDLDSVDLDGAWSFGTSATWAALVAACPLKGVEPEEPVQAAVLAHLRWSLNNSVHDVQVHGANLHIEFGCGETLATRVGTLTGGGTDWGISGGGGRAPSSARLRV